MSQNPTPRVSEILAGVAAVRRKHVAVSDVLEAFGDRAFGALMFVFAAPLALPMPPGVSAILGAPLLFISAQWMVGRKTLWLPRIVTERTMTRSDFAAMLEKVTPFLSWLESHLRRRLSVLYGRVFDRITGLMCLVLAIIVFLPIPFGNMLPSFALAVFGLGLAERDGVAALVGWSASALSVMILAVLSNALIQAFVTFFRVLLNTF
ncbi:hypothetical protein QO010_004662 [Caulobacter ginsengisoli]|uniref:Exopolysaccharide biosynthesis protein n=1 Tax=Caulobacter ginsengisoli TaxID=400775 RepID=A0ABU0IXZ4_9CAUL|nr:exopolysaccharide biosynthesis protein [Caulobacter ginsengisoli]MDQ0466865.1 hypothetical protein [Caulobacter ginsengisoli]